MQNGNVDADVKNFPAWPKIMNHRQWNQPGRQSPWVQFRDWKLLAWPLFWPLLAIFSQLISNIWLPAASLHNGCLVIQGIGLIYIKNPEVIGCFL